MMGDHRSELVLTRTSSTIHNKKLLGVCLSFIHPFVGNAFINESRLILYRILEQIDKYWSLRIPCNHLRSTFAINNEEKIMRLIF